MNHGNGVSRGDRNRNARLNRLRAAVPVSNAIVGIDLADRKQMVVVTDHDSKVLARRTYQCRAWDLGAALDWAKQRGSRAGYDGVTVAWRAIWGALQNNPIYAARYQHLTTRETNKLKPTQAQAVLAGALLRQLHAVITTGQAWDPNIATHGTRQVPATTGVAA